MSITKSLERSETVLNALNEAVDAIGDIPAENTTKQQQEAYRMCMDVRDELIGEKNEGEVDL